MDIVEKLRFHVTGRYDINAAATEIERLREENERLKEENKILWDDMFGMMRLLHKMKNKTQARKALEEKE
jgi:hypothetical protein